MEKNKQYGNNDFRMYLVSKLFSLIGNWPIYCEKKLTKHSFDVDGLKKAITSKDGLSFFDNPIEFLEKNLGVDQKIDSFAVAMAIDIQHMVLSSDNSEKLKIACKECLRLSDDIYPY